MVGMRAFGLTVRRFRVFLAENGLRKYPKSLSHEVLLNEFSWRMAHHTANDPRDGTGYGHAISLIIWWLNLYRNIP